MTKYGYITPTKKFVPCKDFKQARKESLAMSNKTGEKYIVSVKTIIKK